MNAINPHRFSVSTAAWKLPSLTVEQKRYRRLENLLLDSPAGFYKSHLVNNISCNEHELNEYLKHLGAVKLNGFWIHPVYIKLGLNSFSKDQPAIYPANAEGLIFDALTVNPDASITSLLTKLKTADIRVLKGVLEGAVRPDIDKYFQQLAIKYLYVRFATKKQPYMI